MERFSRKIAGVLALTVLAGAAASRAAAQDYIPGTNPMDIANTTMSYMNTHINNITLENMTRGKGRGSSKSVRRKTTLSPMRVAVLPASSLSGVRLAPAGAAALGYRPVASVREEAKRAFIARIAGMNPQAGSMLAKGMKSFDMFAEFPKMVGDEGLKGNHVADALAACLVGTWVASKGKLVDPDNAGVRVVRARIATALLADPRMKSAAFRQRLGDELQLMTVFVLSGFGGALKTGQQAVYGNAMAGLFQGMTGVDPRSLALTSKGFVRA